MINSNLLHKSRDISRWAENHDRWIAIIAALHGRVEYIDECTLTHRIHSSNKTVNENATKASNRIKYLKQRFVKNENPFVQYENLGRDIINNFTIENTWSIRKFQLEIGQLLKLRGLSAAIFALRKGFYSVNPVQTFLLMIQIMVRK